MPPTEPAFAFIVLGAGRGGTSLLAGLLESQENLVVEFERFSRECLMGEEIRSSGPELFRARVNAFLSACQSAAADFPGKLYGNKITTEQLYALEDHNAANPDTPMDILDAFFNQYLRHIKVVYILRDGRTCVRSKMVRTGQSLELACERWRFSAKVYRFLRSRAENNISIKYEDLLTRPETTLEEVCSFLDVSFQGSMLEGTQNPKMRPEYRQAHLNLSKLELKDIPAGCVELIYDDLKSCGYL